MQQQKWRLLRIALILCFCISIARANSLRAHERRSGDGAKPSHPSFAPVDDNPELPRVLLLGDSISMGYTLNVRERLAGIANVHRATENCETTKRGMERLDAWLGDGQWNVIHFNFGLHDLARVDGSGERVAPELGQPQVPLDQYEQNLRKIIERLRETEAKLIWCATTPVPEGADARAPADVPKYNAVAARVMREMLGEERVINDLHAFAAPQLDAIQIKENVHFTPEGSIVLGEHVAAVIEANLPAPRTSELQTAKGVVYHDVDSDGKLTDGDFRLAGVRVSNGRDIVKTDRDGRYALPVDDDAIVFVIKPRGWRSEIQKDMLPKFYYIHKPNGSPESKYAGVAPTGPLPESIDFPLYPQEEPKLFKAIMFGDPQPRNQQEVDYMAHDVIEELVGADAAFGVTLGDIAFNNLDVFEPQARAIAVLGIPWYNVIGNHDINFEAKRDEHSDESFERVFGPTYYSFDHGPVHFLVLDDIEWLIDENGEGQYQGGLGPDQVAFIKNDLALIPKDQLVVLMMHIPITDIRDRHSVYRLIEQRPFCMSISAHRHFHEHRLVTEENGWRGPKPHHHVVNVTVSGSWWSGMPDERGIPHTLMADGAPNGYSIMTFSGNTYQLDFKAAGRSKDYQMNIYAPEVVSANEPVDVLVNVFNGSPQTTVEIAVDDADAWTKMARTIMEDPAYQRMREREMLIREKIAGGNESADPDSIVREITKPKLSTHIWKGELPADLSEGVHTIRIRATDMDGRMHTGYRLIRVESK